MKHKIHVWSTNFPPCASLWCIVFSLKKLKNSTKCWAQLEQLAEHLFSLVGHLLVASFWAEALIGSSLLLCFVFIFLLVISVIIRLIDDFDPQKLQMTSRNFRQRVTMTLEILGPWGRLLLYQSEIPGWWHNRVLCWSPPSGMELKAYIYSKHKNDNNISMT